MADINPDRAISIPGFNEDVVRKARYRRLLGEASSHGIDHDFDFPLDAVLSIGNSYSFVARNSFYFVQFDRAVMKISQAEYELLLIIMEVDNGHVYNQEAYLGGAGGQIFIPKMCASLGGYRAFLKKHRLDQYPKIQFWEIWDALEQERR